MSSCGCQNPNGSSSIGYRGTSCALSYRRTPNPIGPSCDNTIAEECATTVGTYTACEDLNEFIAHQRGADDLPDVTPEANPDQYGPCGLIGPGNQPIRDCEYQTGLVPNLQSMVDMARRRTHTLGLRPYRVFLVWQKRDSQQIYQEIQRIELVPVKVSNLSFVNYELGAGGLHPEGGIRLTQISPKQANERTLRGYINGALPKDDEEFFYEVRRIPMCEGEGDKPLVRRFTIDTLPHFNGGKFGWEVGLTDQEVPRTHEGEDRTFKPLSPLPLGPLDVLKR